MKPLKIDLHIHTSDDTQDSIQHGPEKLVDRLAKHGFNAFAVTNHDTPAFSQRLRDCARERGLTLIPGMELTYRKQHIGLLNFKEPDGLRNPSDIQRAKGRGNLVFAPHPYFPWAPSCGRMLDEMPELFDAIEFSHLYNDKINFNRKAVARARELGLPMVGTSDAHTLFQIGYTFTLVQSENEPEAILEAIKSGCSEVVSRPFPFARFLWVIAFMKYGSLNRIIKKIF